MLKILIADDHSIVRRGLKQVILDSYPDAEVYEATSGNELLRMLKANPLDVIILDIVMPGMDGVETLIEVKRQYPRIPVLILSMHPEDRFAVRVLRSGASGYLNKDTAPDELTKAIQTVLGGSRFITPSIAELLADTLEQGDKKNLVENLSNREFQVFRLLAAGKTGGEIAEALSLSVNTVSTYRSRVMEKLELKTNAELTYFAISNGQIDKHHK
jgi:DNA-binding NarL/FixJ family response regulator